MLFVCKICGTGRHFSVRKEFYDKKGVLTRKSDSLGNGACWVAGRSIGSRSKRKGDCGGQGVDNGLVIFYKEITVLCRIKEQFDRFVCCNCSLTEVIALHDDFFYFLFEAIGAAFEHDWGYEHA